VHPNFTALSLNPVPFSFFLGEGVRR